MIDLICYIVYINCMSSRFSNLICWTFVYICCLGTYFGLNSSLAQCVHVCSIELWYCQNTGVSNKLSNPNSIIL